MALFLLHSAVFINFKRDFSIIATEGNSRRSYEANRKIIRSSGPLNDKGPYRGTEITINLPAGVDANKIKWLSVWCELFNINFGDVEFSVPS